MSAGAARSALIVAIPEAEAVVGPFRARHDRAASEGVPAHVTVLYPFMPPERIGAAVLTHLHQALSTHPRFAVEFDRVARFPEALYLAPRPAAPFITLTRAIARCFPDYPPYAGRHDDIVPHLSIASDDRERWDAVEEQISSTLARRGPICASCSEVLLIDDSSGRWRTTHSFSLR